MKRLALIVLAAGAFVAMGNLDSARAQEEYLPDVQICLQNWKTHPFSKDKPTFRVIEPRVKVMGIGGNTEDATPTDKPELVYIRPNVSVMSKSILDLKNPNGWYCLGSSTAVMAKVEINLDCRAHLASAREGVTVLGGGEKGVNVMGATAVNVIGCDGAPPN
jgi:hypothetical protein